MTILNIFVHVDFLTLHLHLIDEYLTTIPCISEFRNNFNVGWYLYSIKIFVGIYVSVVFLPSLEPIKSFEAPATINSASLHPEKEFLVAGGEDFKLYKYDYNSGEELGKSFFLFFLFFCPLNQWFSMPWSNSWFCQMAFSQASPKNIRKQILPIYNCSKTRVLK